MSFTVSEMEAAIRSRLNEPTQARLTSAEILTALNDGYKDVALKTLCIENEDVVYTVSGRRTVPFTGHRTKFVYTGLAGGGGGGSDSWWQQAAAINGSRGYFSVLTRGGLKIAYLKKNFDNNTTNYLEILTLPQSIGGQTVATTAGYQGNVVAKDDFVVFLHDVISGTHCYLVVVRMLKSPQVNYSVLKGSGTFAQSTKAVVVCADETIVVAYRNSTFPTIQKSTDYGITWTTVAVDTNTSGRDAQLSYDSVNDIIYLATQYRIYKSTDQGDTWAQTASGLNFNYYDSCFQGGVLYVVGGANATPHTLWRLIDGIVDSTSTITYTYYYPNIVNTSNGLVLYEPYYTKYTPWGPFLLTSTDGGLNWTESLDMRGYDMPYGYNNSLASDDTQMIFMGCEMTVTEAQPNPPPEGDPPIYVYGGNQSVPLTYTYTLTTEATNNFAAGWLPGYVVSEIQGA